MNNNSLLKDLLIMGRDSAAQLTTVLEDHSGPGSARELAEKVLGYIEGALSLASAMSVESGEGCHTPVGSQSSGDRSFVDSGESGKRPAAKERRGGYKRRKTSNSEIQVSSTMEDGYAWRKYGQKAILNANYPRCYYRCTHKPDQGCMATKQVQIIAEEPQKYQTTYFGHHTCTKVTNNPTFISLVSNTPYESHLISFEPENSTVCEQDHDLALLTPSMEEENKEGIQSELVIDTGLIFWQDGLITEDEDLMSGLNSSASTGSYNDSGMEFLADYADFNNEFHFGEG